MTHCSLCGGVAIAHSFCWKHLQRFYRHKNPHHKMKTGRPFSSVCKICGAKRDYEIAYQLCQKCYKEDMKRKKIEYEKLYPGRRNFQRQEWIKRNRKKIRDAWNNRYKRSKLVRLKHFARVKFHRAIKSGKLIKKDCELCGSKKTEGHHTNYNQPLNVQWLCRDCHRKKHALQ